MNKTEIDHIGAYLCGHKVSELLNLHYNCLKVLFEGQKRHLKNLEQWRLFCFVFVFKQVKNCHSDDNRNEIGRRFTAFVFKQFTAFTAFVFKRRQMATETTIGQTTIGRYFSAFKAFEK